MHISHIEIANFRALESVSVPLHPFSILIGENDVGKSSLLYALNAFYDNKKLSSPDDWFKRDTTQNIVITVTYSDVPEISNLPQSKRQDGTVVIRREFPIGKPPNPAKVVIDRDNSALLPKGDATGKLFGSDSFLFIPVRRDLNLQFAVTKTALLGRIIRNKMHGVLDTQGASEKVAEVKTILQNSINEVKNDLQNHLQEQAHNDRMTLDFTDLRIDPVEGVHFDTRVSDELVDNILIEQRGAGTQHNLIIALFRLAAKLESTKQIIFALEEPENSLHPKAQRQLFSAIQSLSETSQVIVTTHSPVFIDRGSYESNIWLTRTTKGNTVAKTFDMSMLEAVRTDLGIMASDALLKGGGNCAILVEGETEEDGFPIFMEMLGMSEFHLGISIINLKGCDYKKVRNAVTLLKAYGIPCVAVLDGDAQKSENDLRRMMPPEKTELDNLMEIFVLKREVIEDYYPLEIVAEVINKELKSLSKVTVTAASFDESKNGKERLSNFKKVLHDIKCGDSLSFLKRQIGKTGTRIMKERKMTVPDELRAIFKRVKEIAES